MHIPKHLKLVSTSDKGKALLANRHIKKGEVIVILKGVIKKRSESSPMSVQIDKDSFINSEYYPHRDLINHSCDPNTKINFKTYSYVAIRDIKKGEEIGWNYLTTEYDLACDNLEFDCKCDSKDCVGKIKGFKFLSNDKKRALKLYLSPYLRNLVT